MIRVSKPHTALQKCVVRCRAPLRLGLAGGGTDLSPYCDEFGGTVLNATITRYALATIQPRSDGRVLFISNDLGECEELEGSPEYSIDRGLKLHRALYNRVIREFNGGEPLSLTMTSSVDCPLGAGLGASSALVVSMIGAYRTWLNLPLGEFDIAHMAYEIERIDLGMAGGRQDQYAATFGGVNFMEFAANDRVIVNPLHLTRNVLQELEASLLLCFTGESRISSDIIDKQVEAMKSHRGASIDALHQLKRDALEMKAALLREELHLIADIINRSWRAKKSTASSVSTSTIDTLYEEALHAGAKAGKISGAGGGGFLMLLIDPLSREALQQRLEELGAKAYSCTITQEGVFGWRAPSN